jgi:hypothetical protein
MHTVVIVVAVLFVLAVIVFGYKKVVAFVKADAAKAEAKAKAEIDKL